MMSSPLRLSYALSTQPFFALVLVALALVSGGCLSDEPTGLAKATLRSTTVKFDMLHKPLPEIPLPNNIATRYDPTSATGRRINASLIAPTTMEAHLRHKFAQVDGFGLVGPITIPFTGPLDVQSILDAHRDPTYDLADDVIYLVNIDEASPEFGKVHHLDLGNGNYPKIVTGNGFGPHDPRGDSLTLTFEETDEDKDGDGQLSRDEDSDADGVLDKPNYLPGMKPAADDLAGRADALMTFYDSETNTLVARPLVPLRERTTYAVVLTSRLRDAQGQPVGSPFAFINHASQSQELAPLKKVLPAGLQLQDVAFAFSFTTQTVESEWKALRDGLYGYGVQAHLASEYPPEVSALFRLRDLPAGSPINPFIVRSEHLMQALDKVAVDVAGMESGTAEYEAMMDGWRYVDFLVVGSYRSPQLMRRFDDEGNWRPLGLQVWPEDLDRVPAKAYDEEVFFMLAVPRKEISVRGQGKPAHVVMLPHGAGSDRNQSLLELGNLARHGLAAVAIEAPSHGIDLNEVEIALIKTIFARYGLRGLATAVVKGRAFDQNNDGAVDSGADFWTSYMFHTRDVVRQSMLDHMQLVRLLRSFDGKRGWKYGIGKRIAGDFDGDGIVDAGGDAPISIVGGSLGGITASLMASLEPAVNVSIPVSAGGILGDVGARAPRPSVTMRMMGPLYVGQPDGEGGTRLSTVVLDADDDADVALGSIDGVAAGDSVVVYNERSGEVACGYISEAGTFRVPMASDRGDKTRVAFYRGRVLSGTDCTVDADAEPLLEVGTFLQDTSFQGELFEQGTPLLALADGLGLRRSNPELRRMLALTPIILDRTDPSVLAPFIQQRSIEYATGEKTGAHVLMVATLGDPVVPVATGVHLARSAGLIEYLAPDARYGKPLNQVLIDTYTTEGVAGLKRHVDETGMGVQMDVENFSGGDDRFGPSYPRLDKPLRIGFDNKDPLGGYSAAVFTLGDPDGEHGFNSPGKDQDEARSACRAKCEQTGGDDPCNCSTLRTFDVGFFMFNMFGRYLTSGGKELVTDLCLSRNDCDFIQPPPAARNLP